MKLINADEFLWKLEGYAITDTDREFCRKVKFALDKAPPVNVIPIEFLNVLAKKRPGMISATISLIKDKWGEEREKDGQVKSEHNGSSQGAENVAADRPPFNGVGTAPDRRLRTAEGQQPDGVFCISKTAGRGKSTARNRITEAVRKIDNLIDTAEPIEEIDDICRKTDAIGEFTQLITENVIDQNYSTVKALVEGCEMFAERAGQSAEGAGIVLRRIMKQVGEIRTALTMPEKEG
jgi:hypothetical protein